MFDGQQSRVLLGTVKLQAWPGFSDAVIWSMMRFDKQAAWAAM